jgi:universal stress protein A
MKKTAKHPRGSKTSAIAPGTRKVPNAPARQVRRASERKIILVPIDFSRESEKALRYAASFAKLFGARLALLHVAEPMTPPDFEWFPLAVDEEKYLAACRDHLASIVARHKIDPAILESATVSQGRAFHEITDVAGTLKASLIIISTHGYTGVKHVLLGSTTERVVRHAPCPVLVVREHEHELLSPKA